MHVGRGTRRHSWIPVPDSIPERYLTKHGLPAALEGGISLRRSRLACLARVYLRSGSAIRGAATLSVVE
jgi:hypothetical protein